LTRVHDRLESIEDLYSDVLFDLYAAIALVKPGDLDIDCLRERVASLESRTSEFAPRLLALERCFDKVPTLEGSPEGTYLVERLTAIKLKAFGFDQSGKPPHLVGRLTAVELKAFGFDQSGQSPQMRIEVLEASESPLIGDPGPEMVGRSDEAMGTMVNGSPSCDGSPPP